MTCDPGYTNCAGSEYPCVAHVCDNNGYDQTCGVNNKIQPDGHYLKNGKLQYWFCATSDSGEYPVDRNLFSVIMSKETGNDQPYCCVKPKTNVQDCENGGRKNSDGTCDCSTAFVTLTDCHRGLDNYSGDGTNNPNPNGQKFNLNYSGKICDIPPTKLPDNFVKSFFYEGDYYKTCTITGLDNPNNNSICNGDTTTCMVNEYGGPVNYIRMGGTICGDNNSQNNRDHQCGQY
jgi:hypothetical protein